MDRRQRLVVVLVESAALSARTSRNVEAVQTSPADSFFKLSSLRTRAS